MCTVHQQIDPSLSNRKRLSAAAVAEQFVSKLYKTISAALPPPPTPWIAMCRAICKGEQKVAHWLVVARLGVGPLAADAARRAPGVFCQASLEQCYAQRLWNAAKFRNVEALACAVCAA